MVEKPFQSLTQIPDLELQTSKLVFLVNPNVIHIRYAFEWLLIRQYPLKSQIHEMSNLDFDF